MFILLFFKKDIFTNLSPINFKMTNISSPKEKSTQITGQISFVVKRKNIFTVLQ